MQTLANEPPPAGFEQVLEAFDTALELPAWRPGRVRIGVARSDGQLVATAVLHDLRQARLFTIQMGGLGYAETHGEAAEAAGCDVVFTPQVWTFASPELRDVLRPA